MPFELDLLPPVGELSFVEDGHRYQFRSARHGLLEPTSVSQVLLATGGKSMNYSRWREALMRDRGLTVDEADAYMEQHRKERAQIGTDVHAMIQEHLTGMGTAPPANEAGGMFEAWRTKFSQRIGTVRLIEQPLIHRACFYVGTPDLVAEVDGRLTLVDWKTCKPDKARVRPEWLLQQGAYVQLVKSCYNLDVNYGMNVAIWDGGVLVQPWNAADLRHAWLQFAGFLMEYHARQASFGSEIHHAALTAMQPMFSP